MFYSHSTPQILRRNTHRLHKSTHPLTCLLILILALLFSGCSGGDAPKTTATAAPGTPTPTGPGSVNLAMKVSQTSVKSDGSDFSTVTATVSKDNIMQSGTTVNFSTTCGLLSTGSQVSNTSGESITTIKANPSDQANQDCTITGTAGTTVSTIPVSISGTTITLSVAKATLTPGTDTELNISVKNAGGIGIHNAPVSISSSSAALSPSPASGTTVNGILKIKLNAVTTADPIKITVKSLKAEATLDLKVISATASIKITSPTPSPITLVTSTPQAITVTGPEGTPIRFVTSKGTWDNGLQSVTENIVGGAVTKILTSTEVGLATVQVYDNTNPTNADSILVYISPPISEAAQVALTFSKTNIAPSTDTLINSLTVYAKVTNADSQPIANVPVDFSLLTATGGGEYLSPVSAVTDNAGFAESTFTSGSSSSGGVGVRIRATEQGSIVVPPALHNSAEGSVVIGGTAVSVGISRSTLALDGAPATHYIMDLSVLVTDSNGNAIPNAEVSLSSWPTRYRLGCNNEGELIRQVVPGIIGIDPYAGQLSIPNEDTNRDTFYSTSEDVGPCDDLSDCSRLVPDGRLNPPSAASGSVPSTVITGANGVANFQLTYLKSYAYWVESEVTARIKVYGTESTAKWTSWLPALVSDFQYLSSSPFGYAIPCL